MENVKMAIEKLIQFGLYKGMIEAWDVPLVRNQLMDILGIDEPAEVIYEGALDETPVFILNELLDYAVEKGLIEDTVTYRDMLDARLMATIMPRPSELVHKFYDIVDDSGIEAATNYYYQLSKDSNYIRMDRIAKNAYWLAKTDVGELEITINLSKPEKDPKEIEKARSMPSANYPKCFLCIDNVGYPGRLNHPARNNHRVIPLRLNHEDWYLQYSPYVYYNEHSIIFNHQHVPMKISKDTFIRLLDFVEQFPHYFVGSNADLPIVGGSILSHDHFQGGHHTFPMETAPVIKTYKREAYPEVTIGLVKWPLSVVRLASKDKVQMIELAGEILAKWRNYSDESLGIRAYSEVDGKQVPHNTITPIARMNQDGDFELDLVLRNNRRSDAHPDGIYHPHAHLHHIKKENIGLIEVMGLAVLPARLKEELSLVEDVLIGKLTEYSHEEKLVKHQPWIKGLVEQYGTAMTQEEAEAVVKAEVGHIFAEVLRCAGVYKMDEAGIAGFERFIRA
ncbi:UDP-glucose--hexose-1-phosphate uridylyltransferase [Vallitalea pronyensis]|uniref:Galactose-1-phosphate uridylyltransferase n=1 Tax=Vallitalea pronyensis TaxID=1348613 RepID=A0A8J8SFE8_9FIRM|nr:UDP-glucose--hexose-1-phosphate uridylyltransferase [Vallitalea pronyensis]QUI21282.1 UDP-glucose--hexose-1-phosphate uridylyltransferase [Vallitalea pronyensis]